MSGREAIADSDLADAVGRLDYLSWAEYGVSLVDVLGDPAHTQTDRLWRLGRLAGIAVKEPFARPLQIKASQSATGARWAWELDPKVTANPPTNTWQFLLLASLIDDRELREWEWLGPTPTWTATTLADRPLPEDLERQLADSLQLDVADVQQAARRIRDLSGPTGLPAEQLADVLRRDLGGALGSQRHVMIALREMQSERGLWRCMAHSAGKYICGDAKLRAAVEEATPAGSVGPVTNPRTLLGAGAASAGNALADVVPWLNASSTLVVTAFLIVIGSVGIDGFCDWIGTELEMPQNAGHHER